jgi:hypothetical protein
MESVLDGIKEIQSILDDSKESIEGGLHLRLCNATLAAYSAAEAVKAVDEGQSDYEVEDEEEESDEEPSERTEDDMELNELAELWGWNFDFGRPNAVLPLEGLIEIIVEADEEKRVCAAVRVLNRAVRGSKPDDPADAERILQWKEELVELGAIRACVVILEGDREFCGSDDDSELDWMYSCLCDEILELFQRLGKGDALFRTKLRRNGALKGVKEQNGISHLAEDVLDMLQQR